MTTTIRSVRTLILCGALICLSDPTKAGAQERTAILKGEDILLLGPDHSQTGRLTADARPKGHLRWLPDGRRLSYLVGRPDHALALLAIVDLTGKIQKELLIRSEETDPYNPIRYVEEIDWITDTRIRYVGSVNNLNGQTFELDVDTGKESHVFAGQDGSFVPSPDQAHMAYQSVLWMAPEEEWREQVIIDDENYPRRDSDLVFPKARGDMRVLVHPVWSSDSKRVAFLQRQVGTGQIALSFLSITNETSTVPLILDPEGKHSLQWIGKEVMVDEGPDAVLVDPDTKSVTSVPANMSPRIEELRKAKAKRAESKKATEELVRKMGGREGVTWHPLQSQ